MLCLLTAKQLKNEILFIGKMISSYEVCCASSIISHNYRKIFTFPSAASVINQSLELSLAC